MIFIRFWIFLFPLFLLGICPKYRNSIVRAPQGIIPFKEFLKELNFFDHLFKNCSRRWERTEWMGGSTLVGKDVIGQDLPQPRYVYLGTSGTVPPDWLTTRLTRGPSPPTLTRKGFPEIPEIDYQVGWLVTRWAIVWYWEGNDFHRCVTRYDDVFRSCYQWEQSGPPMKDRRTSSIIQVYRIYLWFLVTSKRRLIFQILELLTGLECRRGTGRPFFYYPPDPSLSKQKLCSVSVSLKDNFQSK